jgi:hypothetical protein
LSDVSDDKVNADAGVRLIVRVLDVLERGVLYELLYRWKRLRSPNLAWGYVLCWIAALTVMVATTTLWDDYRGLRIAMALVAAYRAFDLLRWYSDFLLDERHNHVLSRERNLVFAVLNLVETILIAAIWLEATGASEATGSSLFVSFALVTQLDLPAVATFWAKAAVVVTEAMALTILLGGIAVLIAEVQDKVHSTGTWRGQSSGDK